MMEGLTVLKKIDDLPTALKILQKLTEDLPTSWEVDRSSLKVPLSHGMLTEVDGMSPNLTKVDRICRKVTRLHKY